MIQVGVTIQEGGAALVTCEHQRGEIEVIAIESLSFNVASVATRAAEVGALLERPQFVVDGVGLGAALWQMIIPNVKDVRGNVAAREKHKDGAPLAWLYQARGIERQALINSLVVGLNQKTLHFAKDLPEMDAMSRALLGYHREVKEDGQVGPQLVTALCLGLIPRLLPIRHVAFLA